MGFCKHHFQEVQKLQPSKQSINFTMLLECNTCGIHNFNRWHEGFQILTNTYPFCNSIYIKSYKSCSDCMQWQAGQIEELTTTSKSIFSECITDTSVQMHGLNQFNAFKAPGHLLELKGPHSYYNCHNIHILRKDFISIYNTKNLGTLGDDLILAVGAMTFRFFDYKYGLCFRHMSFVPLLHLIDN